MIQAFPAKDMLALSVGVFAHNEAANILGLLRALDAQELRRVEIKEIIVVSSASTDGTDDLVREYALSHPAVGLITQEKREGKSSAINLFLAEASQPLLLVISGDVVPDKHCLERVIGVFRDPKVGAAGGRPVPVNDPSGIMGYAVHLLWRLHHRMALRSPKLGEMIAFRNVIKSIPADSAVDEASIEAQIREQGYMLRYKADAIIKNRGPENFRDFVKQRRRIQNGHLWLKTKQHYTVASQDSKLLFGVMLDEILDSPLDLPKLLVVIAMETYCRLLGSIDFYWHKKNPFAWDIASSTKDAIV